MEVLDDEGRVFGVVNVIDLLVVLLVLAVVAAGAALVLGGGSGTPDDQSETATITVRAENVQPYVADALSTGSVDGGNVTRIENKSVQPTTVYTENESGAVLARDHPRLKTVEIEVVVELTDGPGGPIFGTRPLRVGRTVTIDSGDVVLTGDVKAIEAES
jgi:hypothetical protein